MVGLLVCCFIYFCAAFLFFSLQTGNKLLTVHEHTKQINDIQMYKDQTMFVTASKDHTAKVGVGRMTGKSESLPSVQLVAQVMAKEKMGENRFKIISLK